MLPHNVLSGFSSDIRSRHNSRYIND